MNPDPLDELLNAYARKTPPPPPPEEKAPIWRQIEARRQRHSTWAGLFPVLTWRELFKEPRMAIAALAIALVTGIVPAAAATSLRETPRVARDSLHLDVFTTCPSCLPTNFASGHRTR